MNYMFLTDYCHLKKHNYLDLYNIDVITFRFFLAFASIHKEFVPIYPESKLFYLSKLFSYHLF